MFLFVAAELCLRAFHDTENYGTIFCYDPALGWSLQPNATLHAVDHLRHVDHHIVINEHGLREADFAIERTPGRRRILFVGDSVTFGSGVEAEVRTTDFMDRALGDDVEVINAGVAGWGTDQELIYYEREGRHLQPDVLILQVTMANDIVNNMLDHLLQETARKPRFVLSDGELVLENDLPARPDVPLRERARAFLRRSRFLVFVKRRVDVLRGARGPGGGGDAAGDGGAAGADADARPRASEPEVPKVPSEMDPRRGYSSWSVFARALDPGMQDAWRVTEAIIDRFAAICAEDGTKFLVFAFPLKLEVDVPWRRELMAHLGLDPNDYDFERPYRRLQGFCDARGIEFLYPLDAFLAEQQRRPLSLERDGHPNAFGHAMAARVLLTWLEENAAMHFHVAAGDLSFYPLSPGTENWRN